MPNKPISNQHSKGPGASASESPATCKGPEYSAIDSETADKTGSFRPAKFNVGGLSPGAIKAKSVGETINVTSKVTDESDEATTEVPTFGCETIRGRHKICKGEAASFTMEAAIGNEPPDHDVKHNGQAQETMFVWPDEEIVECAWSTILVTHDTPNRSGTTCADHTTICIIGEDGTER